MHTLRQKTEAKNLVILYPIMLIHVGIDGCLARRLKQCSTLGAWVNTVHVCMCIIIIIIPFYFAPNFLSSVSLSPPPL